MADLPAPPPIEIARVLFNDGRLRLKRTDDHLADLKARIDTYVSAQHGNLWLEVDEEKGFGLVNAVENPPREWSVIVGEIVYNLRAALDYLVYALAWLDSGSHQPKTQFPIEDSPDVFERKRSTLLKGVSDEHAAAIKALQPFEGGAWLRTLAGASNQDKHRALNITTVGGSGDFRFDPPISKADAKLVIEGKVQVHHTATINVTFPNGPPVLKALKALQSEVRAVIDAFEREFEG